MVDIRVTDGWHTANIRRIFVWYTADIRPKTDPKFFIMSWLYGRYIQLICGWHTSYADYTADMGQNLILNLKLLLMYWCHSYYNFMVTKISVLAVYQPHGSRMSAAPYVRRISVVCQPSVSRRTAVWQPFVRRLSATLNRSWNNLLYHFKYISYIDNLNVKFVFRKQCIFAIFSKNFPKTLWN